MVKRGVTEAILKELYRQTQPLIIYTTEQVVFYSCAGDFKLTFLSQCHLVLHLLVFCKFLEQQWDDVIRSATQHSDAVSFLFSPESGLFWAQFLKQAKCIAALQLIQYSNKHFIVRQVIYWLRTQKNHCNNWSVSLWWLRCERRGLDLFHHFTFIQWEWLSKFTRNELTLGSLKGPERREVEKNNLLFLQLYGNNLKWLYNLQAKKLSGIN